MLRWKIFKNGIKTDKRHHPGPAQPTKAYSKNKKMVPEMYHGLTIFVAEFSWVGFGLPCIVMCDGFSIAFVCFPTKRLTKLIFGIPQTPS